MANNNNELKQEVAIPKRQRGRPGKTDQDGALRLLQQARMAFSSMGYEAVSLRAIARACAVDPALVAHHFGSKEALWKAVIDQMLEPLTQELAALLDAVEARDVPVAERLTMAITRLVNDSIRFPEFGALFIRTSLEQGERLHYLIERALKPHRDAFVPLLQEGMEQGVVPRQEPGLLYFMLMNAVSITITYQPVFKEAIPLPDEMDAFREALIHSSLAMLGLV